jgi:hypothetical protein
VSERFDESYLRLCQKQGKAFLKGLPARAGDWVLSEDGPRLLAEGDAKGERELVVPDVERLLELLRQEAPIVILDCQQDGFGLTAFDHASRPLANVVSRNAPEACLRALLFIRAERAANEIPLTQIP